MILIGSRHEFFPQLGLWGGVSASCSCGWTSAYTHAFEKYAKEDWDHHIDILTESEKH